MATFAERMRERMDELGMKQVDLVRRTGISKSLISMYLSGEFKAKQQNIYRIALALGVNEAWLMGFDVDRARRNDPPRSVPAPVVPDALAFKLARLDASDLAKVEAYTDGLLDQDKYKSPPAQSAG